MWAEELVNLGLLWVLLHGWIPRYLIKCSHCSSLIEVSPWLSSRWCLGCLKVDQTLHWSPQRSINMWWVSPLLLQLFNETCKTYSETIYLSIFSHLLMFSGRWKRTCALWLHSLNFIGGDTHCILCFVQLTQKGDALQSLGAWVLSRAQGQLAPCPHGGAKRGSAFFPMAGEKWLNGLWVCAPAHELNN